MPANRRVRKGATDTLTAYFYDGGETPVDKGAVTVTVSSDLGTVLQSGTATNTAGTYTFNLSTAATAALDLLTVTWASGTETITQQVEIVGGFYFDLADLRAMNDLGSNATYPTERLRRVRDWIENIIDQAVGASFVRRYARQTFNWSSGYAPDPYFMLVLPYGKVLLSMSINGTALTAPQLAALTIDQAGRVVQANSGIQTGYSYGLIDVRYESALFDACPGDLRDAALQAARWRLISTDGQSGIPSRATSLTNEFGNVQLSTAGNRRPTGIPDVDAVIMSYADQYLVPGIA